MPAGGSGSCRLTCLVTPGNGCLSEVLDFLVLLQKALQKPGGFLNGNAKASSKPLLTCASRNATVRSGPNPHPGRTAVAEAVADSVSQGAVGATAVFWLVGMVLAFGFIAERKVLASLDWGLVIGHLLQCGPRACRGWQVKPRRKQRQRALGLSRTAGSCPGHRGGGEGRTASLPMNKCHPGFPVPGFLLRDTFVQTHIWVLEDTGIPVKPLTARSLVGAAPRVPYGLPDAGAGTTQMGLGPAPSPWEVLRGLGGAARPAVAPVLRLCIWNTSPHPQGLSGGGEGTNRGR